MERSSPLAAMQPPSFVFGLGHGNWTCGAERPTSNPSLMPPSFLGQNGFNFREMSAGRQNGDYFSMQPSRGNSPTANLAVDLSQNFHIDRSPAPHTPRRSLFGDSLLGVLNASEALRTPPPSSSPSEMIESMEISPLPHKAPFTLQVHAASPTPEASPTDESAVVIEAPAAMVESPVEMKPPVIPERKRANVLRPTLTRTKGYSTTSLATKSATFPSSQPFAFNTVAAPAVASLSLDDCFAESPPRNFSPSFALPAQLPRSKSATQKSSAFALPTGSPSAGPVRKMSAPYHRPRKQFRRTLSMFEHPEDVIQQHAQESLHQSPMQSIMDLDEGPQLQLPHFFPEQESIPRITKDTMVDILDGKFAGAYAKSMVVDCRFEYEYKGGHIDGAVNFNNKEELAKTLFQEPCAEKILLIFHCEYSAHRAPIAARFIRGEDRNTNAHQYPKLTYPEVYILDGGYSSFFKDHKSRCFPQNYVEMNDKEHVSACERGLGRIKQQRTKLCRAQTFAFGQHIQVHDSPTAIGRQCNSLMTSMDIIVDEPLDLMRRLDAKRTVSY